MTTCRFPLLGNGSSCRLSYVPSFLTVLWTVVRCWILHWTCALYRRPDCAVIPGRVLGSDSSWRSVPRGHMRSVSLCRRVPPMVQLHPRLKVWSLVWSLVAQLAAGRVTGARCPSCCLTLLHLYLSITQVSSFLSFWGESMCLLLPITKFITLYFHSWTLTKPTWGFGM